MTIVKTSEYELLKKHPGNRPIDPLNLKKITNSIRMKNMLEIRPIVVNQDMEIIDGQHRLEAAKSLGLPIFYIVRNKAESKDIILLNNAQKPWEVEDYVNYYASQGIQSYIDLKRVCEKNECTVNIMMCYMGMRSGRDYKTIKEGGFTLSFEEMNATTRDKISIIKQTVQYIREKTLGNQAYLDGQAIKRGLLILLNSKMFSYEVFMNKLQIGISRIYPCSRAVDFYEMFRSIYNFRNTEPIPSYKESLSIKEEPRANYKEPSLF